MSRLIGRDPDAPLRFDAREARRSAEMRLRAAGRLIAAPFVELLAPSTASDSAAEVPPPLPGVTMGRLGRHRRPVSLAACLLIVAVAATTALPSVSNAGDLPLPDSGAPSPDGQAQPEGAAFYPADGTIYNIIQAGDYPTAGSGFRWYSVVGGDTLKKIAGRFDISTDTLYWANKNRLPYPESIQIGLRLLIPPVDGVVVVLKAGDSLSAMAQRYKIATQAIVIANALPDETVTAGQVLVIPVAVPAMPTSKPGCVGSCGSSKYTGGTLRRPILGYYTISQYYSSRHPAVDFAAATGTPVVAAAGGTVVYAGWKSSGGGVGGGIVVWINHNGKLYTTYNHLSAEFVSAGQTVSAGQRIGNVGMTGSATGPHLHFEVWVCYPWTGGSTGCARNPLRYLP